LTALLKELTGIDLGQKATIATVDLISSATDRDSATDHQTANTFDFVHFKDAMSYVMQRSASSHLGVDS
jgi:hypothetical protein